MKAWGTVLIIVGVVWLLVAFNLDTSVETGAIYGPVRVQNIGLIADRQNHLMLAGLMVIVGTIMAVLGASRQNPLLPVERPSIETRRIDDEPPCERDLSLDAYRLWLASKYDITRNEVFERFVLDSQTYPTLDEALAQAHAKEISQTEARSKEKELLDAEDAEWAAGAEQRALDRAELDRISKQQSYIGFGALCLLVITVTAISYFFGL